MMFTRKKLGLSLAILLTTSTLYGCSSPLPQTSFSQSPATTGSMHALSSLPEQAQVLALMQRLQNIGWVTLNSTGLRIAAATVVLRNNVQTSLTNLSIKHFDDFRKFAVMTENANIDDVIQIIDIMLTIYSENILNIVSEAPTNPQRFEDMVYYATCHHDLITRGRGCEFFPGENPYDTEYNPAPSPTATCTPSFSNCQVYNDVFSGNPGVHAERADGNELFTLIYVAPGTPNGRTMFNQMWRVMGPGTDVLQGNWYGSDNLKSFNDNCAAGMNDVDSAWNTFTGKMAREHGFNSVVIKKRIPDIGVCPGAGPYTTIEVKFYK